MVWKEQMNGRKRGQEEIVGFVVIVVLVLVALVIFLGIFLRRGSDAGEKESREIYQFLESMMQYTSSCSTSYEPDYSDIGELIEKCYSGLGRCTSGREPCEVLKEEIGGIIDASFFVSGEGAVKGYEFKSVFTSNLSEEEIIFISAGNCSSAFRGSEILTPAYPGTIVSSMKLCF